MTETAVVQRSLFVANALCMLSMVVWSIGLPAISHLVQIMPPLTLTAYRLGISGVVLVLAWGFWEGWSTVRHAPWLRGIGIGFVVMGVVAVMVAIAIKLTDPVTVAEAVDSGEYSPLVEELANVLYNAIVGLIKYL